jgi:hypothetical protein
VYYETTASCRKGGPLFVSKLIKNPKILKINSISNRASWTLLCNLGYNIVWEGMSGLGKFVLEEELGSL